MALPGPSPLAVEFGRAGATLHVVPMRRLSTTHGARQWLAYAAGWPVAVVRLSRLVRRLDVDVVHTNSLHSLYGWAAARLTRLPHVWHAREIVVQSRLALRLERFLCRRFANRVIAVSESVAAQLRRDNVVVVDEYLDPTEFSPGRAGRFRSGAGIADDAPLVGAVARLHPLKGLDLLLEAFDDVRSRRPDARLVVVGSPVPGHEDYAAALAAAFADRPDVELLGSRHDVGEIIADLDVLAAPSIEPESYGLVVVEALSSGVPVVATDHGGPPELLARAARGAGRLVPPGDRVALAHALDALLPGAQGTSAAIRRARSPLLTLPPPRFAEIFRGLLADAAR